jgi:hypothetical protein
MASRSRPKAEAAIAELKEDTGKEAIFLELDLSDLASVRKAAEEFMRFVIVPSVVFVSNPDTFAAKNLLYMSCTPMPGL